MVDKQQFYFLNYQTLNLLNIFSSNAPALLPYTEQTISMEIIFTQKQSDRNISTANLIYFLSSPPPSSYSFCIWISSR